MRQFDALGNGATGILRPGQSAAHITFDTRDHQLVRVISFADGQTQLPMKKWAICPYNSAGGPYVQTLTWALGSGEPYIASGLGCFNVKVVRISAD